MPTAVTLSDRSGQFLVKARGGQEYSGRPDGQPLPIFPDRQ